jgi:translocation and assembly module TamB
MNETPRGPKFEEKLEEKLDEVKAVLKKPIRSAWSLAGRIAAWIVSVPVVLTLLLAAAGAWYTTTHDFQQRVNREVVKTLEDATGGRVELHSIRFSLWHLAIEADGLVIHGLEGPSEAPYLSADKILVRIKVFNFFEHITQLSLASHVSLDYLRVEHPQVHLIVDQNGTTNVPKPKHPRTSKEPVQDTLLDLKAGTVEVAHGVALVNDKATPFELAAHGLEALIHYSPTEDVYGATIDLNDLRTHLKGEPEAQSNLHAEATLGRDKAELTKLEFHSGKASDLKASGSLIHFAKPEWQAKAEGSVELPQVMALTGAEGLDAGSVDLNVSGRSCGLVAATAAPKKPRFWRKEAKPTASATTPADTECKGGFLITGPVKAHNLSFRNVSVRFHDLNGGGRLHITGDELQVNDMTGSLPGGGGAAGRMWIPNWLAPRPAELQARTYIDATVTKIPLRTIMDTTAPVGYGDLGFDTSITGPVQVEWGGSEKDVADSVQVEGDLTLMPTGVKRKGALNDIPVTGHTKAHYDGKTEVVRIQDVTLQTPQSTLEASGVLGVNAGDPLTMLRTELTVRNLDEYNQLLTTLDLEGFGQKGRAAIPISLHGGLQFNGTARGKIADLDVKGHLEMQNFEMKLASMADVLIDSLVADGEYSPNSGVALASSTIERGAALLSVEGSFKPSKILSHKGATTYVWDGDGQVDASVQLTNAPIADVLQIAGQQEKIPVTGTIAVNGHLTGPVKALAGSGVVTLEKGVAYGEAYDSAVAQLSMQGKDIEASRVELKLQGATIAGNGGYDLASEHLHGHIEANHLQLSKFKMVRDNTDADGVLNLTADANGTLTEPGLKADAKLAGLTADGQALGEITANAHSQGRIMYFAVDSTIVGAKAQLNGQTELTGDFATQAKMTFTGLDISKPMALIGTGSTVATSSIGGTVTLSGPLKNPKMLNGLAELNDFDVKLQGIELKTAEPLRVSLQQGVARLEQVHITGQDTDMHASGTAQVLGATDAKGGKLDLKANGSVSMTLLHTFDKDIVSSGKVEFTMAAGGQMSNPALTGKVQFDHVNASIDGVPNGLSNMNGTLVFNEDRLQVQTLTATTGGGQLKIGGSIRFRNGLYADLTATGDVVRVRLYGLSATANANLKFQGAPQSMILSGNILLTRFGVGQNVDFAAFSNVGGVGAAPDPDSASNRIRLDVKVTSSPQLDFQNSYAKLAGTVDLTVRGTVAEPSILGRIQITDGSATFAGTKYQLQRGDVYFSNPVRIDPTIDLDATARVENYDITIGLHGTATNLKPTYRSEPPLSEADVFALLALGRTQEEAQLYQEQQVQQGTDPTTSALLGGALNATVSNRVSKLFGVGSVKIDPAFVGTLGNSSARITVQQQLSRQLTVTFATNVNQTAEQLIQVQYDLNRNMSIVATRDESGVFSVVYKLRRRYR